MESITSISSSSTTQTALAPAFDDASADLIIESSDSVQFRTYKVLLALASPVFRDMFSMPQGEFDMVAISNSSNRSESQPPSIELLEDAQSIRAMLSFCDPRTFLDELQFTEINDIVRAFSVAHKYQMATYTSFLLHKLLPHIPKSPLRVYAIACQNADNVSYLRIATTAARELSRHKLPLPKEMPKPIELSSISAAFLESLYSYHAACKEAAQEALKTRSAWYTGPRPLGNSLATSCQCVKIPPTPGTASTGGAPPSVLQAWWIELIRCAGNALNDIPSGEVIMTGEFAYEGIFKDSCLVCKEKQRNLHFFYRALAEKVDEAVAKVQLELP
jgi:hypothetical protein